MLDRERLRTIAEIAEITGKARQGIYNKLRYGLSHVIVDGTIKTSLKWLDDYGGTNKRGRRAKERK